MSDNLICLKCGHPMRLHSHIAGCPKRKVPEWLLVLGMFLFMALIWVFIFGLL